MKIWLLFLVVCLKELFLLASTVTYPCYQYNSYYTCKAYSVLLFSIDQYMAFGISGSSTSTNMVGADVVVTWINDDGPSAIDYYLTDRQQVLTE